MNRLRAVAPLLVLVLSTAALAGAAPQAASCAPAEWPQPRQSSCGTATNDDARAPALANVRSTELRWRASLPSPVGDPIVSGGLVYVTVGKTKPRLDARDVTTGRYVWSALTGSGGHAPLIDGGILLRESEEGFLRRYDPRSGRILWRHGVSTNWHPIHPQVAAGGVWYQAQTDQLIAVDAGRGAELWHRPLGCWRCVPAVSGDRIYAAGTPSGEYDRGEGRLYAFDAGTRRTLWSARGRGDFAFLGSPMVAGGRIVIVTLAEANGRDTYFANAFSAADGHTLWITKLGTGRGWYPWSAGAAGAGIVAYVVTDGSLYAVDQRTGALRWHAAVGDTDSSPAIANGLVWIVDGSGHLVALSAKDGTAVWRSPEDGLHGAPAVADGLVVVAAAKGLVAYGPPL